MKGDYVPRRAYITPSLLGAWDVGILGSDGNPNPKNDNCIYCSRNEDKDAQEWDDSVTDNFDECMKEVEPDDPYYTWFDEDGGEHSGRAEP